MTTGLIKRGGIYHVNKTILGKRYRCSTGTGEKQEAEQFLAKLAVDVRNRLIYGEREKWTFERAADYYLDGCTKKTKKDDIEQINILKPYFNGLNLNEIHQNCPALRRFINERQLTVKNRTINKGLKVLKYILKLAATEWFDENNNSILENIPSIRLLPQHDQRQPRPITYREELLILDDLPLHLKQMVLFALHTGCRDSEICGLKWEWEQNIEGLGRLFVIPGTNHKNGDDKIVVLNKVVHKVIDEQRYQHATHVFTFRHKPIARMNNNGWRTMRKKTHLQDVRVHDLRHTFGTRLRAAGVSLETRQELLGHRSEKITTHYSAAQLQELFNAVQKLENQTEETPTLLVLKRRR